MSKYIQYPNGFVGVVSDAVAAILITRPGHTIIEARPDKQAQSGNLAPPENTPETLARVNATTAAELRKTLKE